MSREVTVSPEMGWESASPDRGADRSVYLYRPDRGQLVSTNGLRDQQVPIGELRVYMQKLSLLREKKGTMKRPAERSACHHR